MYVLQFKGNLNSQNTVGYGNSDYGIMNTGRADTNGMIYGDNKVAKLFGVEDAWGNIWQFVNNYYSGNYSVNTTTDDTITDVNKYTNRGSYGSNKYENSGYYTDCMGTTEAGFTPTYDGFYEGSSSTYFCDSASFKSNHILSVGGEADTSAGLFCNRLEYVRSGINGSRGTNTGSRLQYL